MKKILLKFGGLSMLTIMVLFTISFFMLDSEAMSYAAQEVFGYLSILISLGFVFFGVRAYRDKELGGQISFWRALGIGMLITLFPALMFGIFNAVYITVINPEWVDTYYAAQIQQLTNSYTGAELKAKVQEVELMKAQFSNPLVSFTVMTLTVILMGFVVSLITSVVLRKKDPDEGLV